MSVEDSVNVSYKFRDNIVLGMLTGIVCICTTILLYNAVQTGNWLLIAGTFPVMALVWFLIIGSRYLATFNGIARDLKLVARQALQ